MSAAVDEAFQCEKQQRDPDYGKANQERDRKWLLVKENSQQKLDSRRDILQDTQEAEGNRAGCSTKQQ